MLFNIKAFIQHGAIYLTDEDITPYGEVENEEMLTQDKIYKTVVKQIMRQKSRTTGVEQSYPYDKVSTG